MQDFVNVLSSLISIKSLASDRIACQRCLDLVVSLFQDLALSIRFKNQQGCPSVLIANTTDTHLDVLFLCHLDIVAASPEQFLLQQEGDKLLGRGVHDMKGPALSVVWALKSFFLQQGQSILKVGALFVTDEETGGDKGSYLWAKELFPKVVVEPDSGRGINQIIERAKQPVFMRFVSCGQSAHGARPWLGIDAIQELLNALEKLRKQGNFTYYRQGIMPENEGWVNTMHIGQIQGGQAMNAVAEKAEAVVDFRLIQNMTDKDLMTLVHQVCSPYVHTEMINVGVPVYTDLSCPVAQLYCQIVQETTQKTVKPALAFGATDGRYFAHKSVLLTHQEDGGDAHGPHEYSSLTSLKQLIKIYMCFLQKMERLKF